MAAPTIDPTSSILAAVVDQQISFQPRASYTPTSWALTSGGLPSGLTLNTTSGKVSGTPTEAGVFEFGLVATNGTGASAEVVFSMGVERIAFVSDASIELDFDLSTRHVSNPRDATIYPLFIKSNDVMTISVGCTKAGVLQDLPISMITLFLREYGEDGAAIALNAGDVVKVGEYDTTRYRVVLDLTEPEIAAALAVGLGNGNDTGAGAWFLATCELEFVIVSEVLPGAGDVDQRITSRSFMTQVVQDLGQSVIDPEPIE